jgi:hypothetical protein
MTDRTWQMSLRGVLMGAGTRYRFASAPEGLGMPPMRTNDLAWLSEDGAYGAGDWLQPRLVRARLWVDGGNAAASEALARTLVAAWAPSRTDIDLGLRITSPLDYVLRGRPRRCEVDLSTLKYGHASASVEFAALDPYLYDADASTGTIPLGNATSVPGVTPNLTFDLVFQPGGTTGPGIAFAGNLGTAPTYPAIVITGPVITPRLENRTTGETFTLDATLVGGDVAVVDMKARTITVNGTSRLDALALGAKWVSLRPGANELAYRSSDGTPPASTCTVTWRHAWY